MARTYARDAKGRFASGGGGGVKAAKPSKGPMGPLTARTKLRQSRAKLAANPSSAQKGAVTRASRKLAKLKLEARRTMPARTMSTGVMRGTVKRRPVEPPTMKTTVLPRQQPRQPGQGAMTQALRGALRDLARADAQRIRDIEAIVGKPIGRKPAASGGQRALPGGAGGGGRGRVTDALRANLRALAQSDARYYRDMGGLTAGGSKGQLKGSSGSGKRVSGGGGKSLPGNSGKGRGRKKKG